MARDLDIKIRQWKSEGWSVTKNPGNHFVLIHPLASKKVYTGSTLSDVRALKNIESVMRQVMPAVSPKQKSVAKKSKPPAKLHADVFKFDTKPKFRGLPDEWVKETDFRDYREEAIAWGYCILRLRAKGFDWDTVRIFKNRFRIDTDFRQQTIQTFSSATKDDVANYRLMRKAFLEKVIAPPKPVPEPVPEPVTPEPQISIEAQSEPEQSEPYSGQPFVDDNYLEIVNLMIKENYLPVSWRKKPSRYKKN
jgi:DNA-binding transcriptional MerR regulator